MMIEPLEGRRMLSVTLVEGVLRVTGNAKSNQFSMFYSPAFKKFFTNDAIAGQVGQVKEFAAAAIKRIAVVAGAGNDFYAFTSTGKIPISFKGGTGNDLFQTTGGTGQAVAYGEYGNDTLIGGGGHDKLFGGPGTDELNGNGGNDTLQGDAGVDTMKGYDGRDVIVARDGFRDVIRGDGGIDKARVDLLGGVVNESTAFDGFTGVETLY
jgi:Ca2+-binding RTX toxin-like protein